MRGRRSHVSRLRRFLRVALILMGALLTCAVVFFISLAARMPDLSQLEPYNPALKTRILASDGTVVATLHKENRLWKPLSSLSKHLVPALLATEDYRFFQHEGVDFRAVARAAYRDMVAGELREGASTITMQLARELVDMPEERGERKAQEALVGWQLERKYGKWELLEIYLNRVYFGAGAYGVHAAAGVYFDKSPADLTLSESAFLIGLIQSPSYLCPILNEEAALRRQREVLDRMLEVKGITVEAYRQAVAESETFDFQGALARSAGVDRHPYFTHYALRELVERYGEERLYRGGLTVVTSLDIRTQETARRLLKEEIERRSGDLRVQTGAVVVLENGSGMIKSLVGGTEWSEDNQFNRSFQALRQPGSCFKPVIYAAALEEGYGPGSLISDSQVFFDTWSPRNADGGYLGRITLRQALSQSRNVPAVKLFVSLGPENVISLAQSMGLGREIPLVFPVALGAFETTPLDLAGAYSVFPNEGRFLKPTTIKLVTDGDGRVLEDNRTRRGETVISQESARNLTSMLRDVVTHGTGVGAGLPGLALAGKTGTSDEYRDAWFCGYSPSYTCVVWTGRDDNKPMNRAFGGDLPASIFQRIMRELHGEGERKLKFGLPPEREERRTTIGTISSKSADSFNRAVTEKEVPVSVVDRDSDPLPSPEPTPVELRDELLLR